MNRLTAKATKRVSVYGLGCDELKIKNVKLKIAETFQNRS